jgi:signal transduction histidine kinase
VIEIGDLPEIGVVRAQMHQLFHNLIANALKFNESNPPVITIKQNVISDECAKRWSVNPSDYIAISVSDNGIGFEKEFEDKIFKMFQRLNQSHYPGTGIGLAICKKITENHGGMLFAESKPNEGSRFSILLPVKLTIHSD